MKKGIFLFMVVAFFANSLNTMELPESLDSKTKAHNNFSLMDHKPKSKDPFFESSVLQRKMLFEQTLKNLTEQNKNSQRQSDPERKKLSIALVNSPKKSNPIKTRPKSCSNLLFYQNKPDHDNSNYKAIILQAKRDQVEGTLDTVKLISTKEKKIDIHTIFNTEIEETKKYLEELTEKNNQNTKELAMIVDILQTKEKLKQEQIKY